MIESLNFSPLAADGAAPRRERGMADGQAVGGMQGTVGRQRQGGVLEASRAQADRSARTTGGDQPAGVRYGVLTTGEPLAAWQRAVIARLEDTPGVLAGGSLLPSHDPEELRALDLDFILSFAPAAVGRPFAQCARRGVWQLFFGDWSAYRGESDGFWEIVDDADVATAFLGQLQDDPDRIRILALGAIRSHPRRPARTLAALRSRAAHWPRQVCLRLLDGSTACFEAEPVRASTAARRRGPRARIALRTRGAVRWARDQLRQIARHEQWNIGVLDIPIQALLDPGAVLAPLWLKAPRRHEFYADPIGIVRDGRPVVFCEHLDYRSGRGYIRAFDVGALERVHTVEIGPPIHLSYPYLIEDEGALYCIPESCGWNEVALYRAERFPDRWRRVATLIAGMPLIDVTPFRHGGRWWLAASLPVKRGANSDLYLYYADALTGPWHPHVGNPVKVDVRSARPGGTPFWKDGVLYRPAQDCSSTYGRRVVINRIVRLTPLSFEEEPAAVVDPPKTSRYAVGLHTIAALGDRTLIDAKRHIFVPAQGWRVLKLGLAQIAGKMRGRLGGRGPP